MFCANAIGTSVQIGGGHAEYMLAHADATMLLPDGLAYEQAAPIFLRRLHGLVGAPLGRAAAGRACRHHGDRRARPPRPKATGFHTIAVSHSPDKDRLIRELGADEIVRDGQGLARIGGADVVLGTSNSADAMADSTQGLRPDGRLVVMGVDTKPL